jgi:DNA invertase Pin-like site-specific DNA recombinase
MRVVALYRVSTEKQENDGASLAAQQRRYRELAAAAGWETVAEFRGQESATRAAGERLVLQQVLETVRAGDVDALWVYEQSRLTRADELEVALLKRELRERHVAVLVGSALHDLADVSGALAFDIQAVVDRAESERFKERVARGRREKALQGRKTGGSAPYGYVNPPIGDPTRGTLKPHPAEAPVVRRIFEATAAGTTGGRLAEDLNRAAVPAPRGERWGKTTLRRILDNPAYLGTAASSVWLKDPATKTHRRDLTNPKAVVIEGAHEPLVTPELFAAAQAQRQGSSTGQPGMLTGFLSIAGRRVLIDRTRATSFYRPAVGKGPWVEVAPVDRLVWDGFTGLIRQRRALAALLSRSRSGGLAHTIELELRDLVTRRGRLEGRLERLVDMRAGGEIPRATFLAKSDEVRRQLLELDESATAARRRAAALAGGYHQRAIAAVAAVLLRQLTTAERRRALRSLVARVDVELAPPRALRRDSAGRILAGSGQKWAAEAIYLQLRRYPGPDRTAAGCAPPPRRSPAPAWRPAGRARRRGRQQCSPPAGERRAVAWRRAAPRPAGGRSPGRG